MLTRAQILALVLVSFGGPVSAEKTQAPNTNIGDPNERICENLIVTGSRLATKRFCGTRAEWADRKRQDREALERAQASPCMLTHNGSGGHPSC
jgi:hypothetical protein